MKSRVSLSSILTAAVIGPFCAVVVLSASVSADLMDDPDGVDGYLVFGGFTENFFDPAEGYVPVGFGNSAPNDHLGVPVDAGTEFGYLNGFSGINVDLDSESIWIEQFPVTTAGGANSWEIWIEDMEWGVPGSIVGLLPVGGDIPGLSFGFTDNSVHFSFPGGNLPEQGFYAHFDLEVRHIPEPTTLALTTLGLLGLCCRRRRCV